MLEELKNLCKALEEFVYLNEGTGYRDVRAACDALYQAIEEIEKNTAAVPETAGENRVIK